jgi:tRNA pseudouridine38-40 synthase
MSRYFLEVSYMGTRYNGFQVQQNANTIQAEIEKAFEILRKNKVPMTGSSRTDAGVHAIQNYLHLDSEEQIDAAFIYKLNAVLPRDIAIRNIFAVENEAHCRFDAVSREYKYYIYRKKNPFLADRAFYFPYKLDLDIVQQAAEIVKKYTDFTSFSKRNTQVKTFNCKIMESSWRWEGDCLVYNVKANRFLRGMVRGLTATMLKVGRNKISLQEFEETIQLKDCTKASFAVPSHGLFLIAVNYPENSLQPLKINNR